MQFTCLEKDFNIRGFYRERRRGEGFIVDAVGLIRFIDFTYGIRNCADIYIREFDQSGQIFVPSGEVTQLLLDQPYQVNDLPVFLKLIYINRRNRVGFRLAAPDDVKITRSESVI